MREVMRGGGGPCAESLCLLLLTALLAMGCGGGNGPDRDEGDRITSAEALEEALASAIAGDRILLGAATLSGSFDVPAGVEIEGRDTVLVAAGGSALRVTGGTSEQPTRVSGLTVRVDANGTASAGILAVDGEALIIEDVVVGFGAGFGLVAQGVGRLALRQVALSGVLPREAVHGVRQGTVASRATDVPLAGLLVASGPDRARTALDMHTVTISNTVGYGAVFHRVDGRWERGQMDRYFHAGVLLESSEMVIEEVAITRGRSAMGHGPGHDYALLVLQQSDLSTRDLQIVGVEGFGVFQSESTSRHRRARIIGTEQAGVWIQRSPDGGTDDPDVLFEQSVLRGARVAGIQVSDGGRLVFRDGIIAETRAGFAVAGLGSLETVGDGIQANSTGEGDSLVELSNAVLAGNARAGLAAAGEDTALEGANVTVCGHGGVREDRWTCQHSEEGRVCTRAAGPAVGDEWSCRDDRDGTTCVTTSEELVTSGVPARIHGGRDNAVAEHCRQQMEALGVEFGLDTRAGLVSNGSFAVLEDGSIGVVAEDGVRVVGENGIAVVGENGILVVGDDGILVPTEDATGVVGENGIAVVGENGIVVVGENGIAVVGEDGIGVVGENGIVVVGEDGFRWQCQTSDGERSCTAAGADVARSRSRDTPGLDGGAGWNCHNGAAGRTCAWSGFGVARTSHVSAEGLAADVEPDWTQRDGLVRSGELAVPMQGVFSSSMMPGLLGGDRTLVGENGVVGENGIADPGFQAGAGR
ncbi:MAG: hypothetical protein EA398_15755 [Deltaproteobacteria bacterium]|nr:MAG: hypothetical protein EA398_15755 [Deltaproteobacteria bacterium]